MAKKKGFFSSLSPSVSPVGYLFLLLFISLLANFSIARGGPAELGYRTGEFLSNWYWLRSMELSGGELKGPREGALSSLRALSREAEQEEVPRFLGERMERVEERLIATSEQTGGAEEKAVAYWPFASKEEEGMELEGGELVVEAGEGSPKKLSYLRFEGEREWAELDVSARLTFAPRDYSGEFSLQLWFRPFGDGGKLVSFGDLKLKVDLQGTKEVLELDHPRLSKEFPLTEGWGSIRDRWNHLALIVKGEEYLLYLDGERLGEGKLEGEISPTKRLTAGKGYSGDLDELHLTMETLGKEGLRFDRPIDYALAHPLLEWMATRGEVEGWRFNAGLVLAGLKERAEMGGLRPAQLGQAVQILRGRGEGLAPTPQGLPEEARRALDRLADLAEEESWSEEERGRLISALQKLKGYLGLD